MIHQVKQEVINGKVQKVNVFNWPKQKYNFVNGESVVKEWEPEVKQIWLINHGWNERAAYMIAFNVPEAEMKRIEK